MRRGFTKNQCDQALENQGGKCRGCGIQFFGKNKVRPEYDHIDGDHSNNNTKNCQAICSNCHSNKSREEDVKRSIKEKNVNFVRCCPFCGKELKGKDYADDVGNRLTTDHLPADEWTPCNGCGSVFKIIRKDSKAGTKKLAGKKVDGVMKHCVHCGMRIDGERCIANIYMKCNGCNAIYGVVIKKYNK